jgi:hypothetical protein
LLLGSSLIASSSLASLTGGAAAGATAAATGIPALPRGGLVPTPAHAGWLYGVYCVSASNCWAVGQAEKPSGTSSVLLNQVLHWTGSKWSPVPVPNPGGTAAGDDNSLASVRCPSANDCWAVGFYMRNKADLNQALHWNGHHWSQVAVPNPAGSVSSTSFVNNVLTSVTCATASNCWAVGEYGHSFGPSLVILNEVLHWNGVKWRNVPVASPAGTANGAESALQSVRCTSPGNCWTDGISGTLSNPNTFFNEMLHWNGSKWVTVHVPNPGGTADKDLSELLGLVCAAAANCWAVGYYGSFGDPDTFRNEALHWDGHHWSLISTPQPDGTGAGAQNILGDVACAGADDCWAVGQYGSVGNNVGFILNQVLHWNGHHWSLVSSPDPAGLANGDRNELIGVRCADRRLCWAVGQAEVAKRPTLNEALRWTGSKWVNG